PPDAKTVGSPVAPSKPVRPRSLSAGQRELQAAIAAAKAGNLDEALQRTRLAIQANPNLEHAYLLNGSVCAMMAKPACEREAYDRGLEALPQSSALLKERALVHLQQGEYADAVQKYEKARAITQDRSADTLADLAYAYIFVDRLAEAKDLADRAVELAPACFTCQMARGQVSLSRRDFSTAVSAFEAAQALLPEDPDAARSVAKAKFLNGEIEAASVLYERLVKNQPDDGRLRVQAAQVAMKAGRYQAAVIHLQVVAAANPHQKKLLEFLAKAQEKAGDKQGAKATLLKASQLK
ncbi:MAG: tetratricopeptide repeat protein, partial [Myxococcota bacterium]